MRFMLKVKGFNPNPAKNRLGVKRVTFETISHFRKRYKAITNTPATDNGLRTTDTQLSFLAQLGYNQLCLLLLTILISTTLFFSLVTASVAADVVLAWDPNTEFDLAGYIIYGSEGSQGPPYEYIDTYPVEDIDLDNPRCMITELDDDIAYYFVVTAFDTQGNESGFSEEVCVENGEACTSSIIAGSSGGGGGGGCFVSASIDNPPANLSLFVLLFWVVMVGIVSFKKKQNPN